VGALNHIDDLRDDFFSQKEKITPEQNAGFEVPFSWEEVKNSIFGSHVEGAPIPDGFISFFYKHLWHLVKNKNMSIFLDFYDEKLDNFRLNFVVLAFIPEYITRCVFHEVKEN
jgi:hypothetical protein